MSRHEIVQTLVVGGAVAVVRMSDTDKLKKIVEAIHKGGISAIEITMTTPNALQVIEELAQSVADTFLIGAGTVLDSETALMAMNAGARYIVSPVFKPQLIHTVHRYDLAAIPAAFTPTEILTAHEYGADIVKIFPADVLGMAFIKAIKAPMPHLQLMPTGGVTPMNAGEWIKAGACAVGVGSALLDKKAIAENNFVILSEKAKILCENIAEARK